ncbi:MAG TPA: bestrophin family ion channel [Bryobacteraceae bacterium]|jgi:hypothetical protein|nr:bestrophin family ion channel [Bryobacteraceae bacterium]
MLLQFAFVQSLGFLMPLASLPLAFMFIALDNICPNIEAPFENQIHDTPMTALCGTVERELYRLGERDTPAPSNPWTGFSTNVRGPISVRDGEPSLSGQGGPPRNGAHRISARFPKLSSY